MPVMDTAWSRALRDPSLRDLPYKIETNEYGQLVMSPQKPWHGHAQLRIGALLERLAPRLGRGAVEFAIETSRGVKLPDVIWISEERWSSIPRNAEASKIAPEICIEVLSKSNTKAEIEEKRRLYFECGAEEVWTCGVDCRMRFFTPSGEQTSSALVPDFPEHIQL